MGLLYLLPIIRLRSEVTTEILCVHNMLPTLKYELLVYTDVPDYRTINYHRNVTI